MASFFKNAGRADDCCADCTEAPCDSCGICCFYNPPVFSDSDLPSSITIDGLTAIHNGTLPTGLPFPPADLYYVTGTNPGDYILNYDGGGWRLTKIVTGGFVPGGTGATCLFYDIPDAPFPDVLVRDVFPSTLTVNGTDTITRVSSTPGADGFCQWKGPKTGGGAWYLQYDTLLVVYSLNGTSKTAPQDGPAGTYGTDTVV